MKCESLRMWKFGNKSLGLNMSRIEYVSMTMTVWKYESVPTPRVGSYEENWVDSGVPAPHSKHIWLCTQFKDAL